MSTADEFTALLPQIAAGAALLFLAKFAAGRFFRDCVGLDARTAQRKTRKKGKRQGKDTRKKDEFARGQ